RVAVHARQLAFEPDLQIIRRSRRPLLRGLEQARRSAVAHHVYRIASMGARVLINGTRYKTERQTTSLLGRWATPQEIAWPILWLASDEASFITGATLAVDGGLSIM